MSRTFNPYDKSSSITLSGSDLIATRNNTTSNGNWHGVKVVVPKSSGKIYTEFQVSGNSAIAGSNGGWSCGVSNLPFVPSTTVLGSGGNGAGYFPWSGLALINGSGSTIQSSATAGGFTVCQALDLDNNKIWWRIDSGNWNNSGAADPATNTGGLAIVNIGNMFITFSAAAQNVATTINLGDTAFSFTVPSGFSALESNPIIPLFHFNASDRQAEVSPY